MGTDACGRPHTLCAGRAVMEVAPSVLLDKVVVVFTPRVKGEAGSAGPEAT